MSRLTNKNATKEGTTIGMPKAISCYWKLKDLEDIEEEIGIDLITFIKIYKARKFFLKNKDYYWKIHHRCGKGIVVGTNKLIYLPFKFYGKTWALTKEELL